MKSLVILCEGIHDEAFLYLLLRSNGYKHFSGKTCELPKQIRDNIVYKLKNYPYENKPLSELNHPRPTVLTNEASTLYILLYPVGGETKFEAAKETIRTFKLSISGMRFGDDDIEQFDYVIFNDADDKGIQSKIDTIKTRYNDIFGDLTNLKNAEILDLDFASLACFIFTRSGEEKGKLEDVILSIMKADNIDAIQAAEKLIADNPGSACVVQEKDFGKAIIGIAGQLKKPGKSNSVIIRESCYIKREILLSDDNCISIMKFLEASISKLLQK